MRVRAGKTCGRAALALESDAFPRTSHLKKIGTTLVPVPQKLKYFSVVIRKPGAMARFGGDEPPSEPGVSSASPGVFDLSDSGLTEFPAKGVVKGLRDAVELDLSHNALTRLPESRLSKLDLLECLSLTGNRLASLPDDLARCDNLRTIYAGANAIVDLAPALEAPVLLHLGLAHNRVVALPAPELCAVAVTLLSLDLTGNSLTDLPQTLQSLAAMPRLRVLSLSGNPLAMQRGYRRAILRALPNLRTLDDTDVSREETERATETETEKTTDHATETLLEVRVEDLSLESDQVPVAEPPVKGDCDETREEEGGDENGDGDEKKDGDENADAVAVAPDDAEFWVQVRLPERTLNTPRVRRTPLLVKKIETQEKVDPPTAEGDADATAATEPGPYFSEVVAVPLRFETRNAFVDGLVFELWRRERFVAEVGETDGETDEKEVDETNETNLENQTYGNNLKSEAGTDEKETETSENEKPTVTTANWQEAIAAKDAADAGDDKVGDTHVGDVGDEAIPEVGGEVVPTEVQYREYIVGTATVCARSFLDGDDDASTFTISEKVTFYPPPALFSTRNDLTPKLVCLLEDAPWSELVGSAIVTCALHVSEVVAVEQTGEGEAGKGGAEEGEAGE